MRIVFFAFGIAVCPAIASADWAEFSAAYLCDQDASAFTVAPVVRTSAAFKLAAPDKRFKPLAKGIDRSLECRLKDRVIRMVYTSSGPQAQRMCRGIGFTEIRALELDGRRIVSATEVNSGCFNESTLVSVRLNLATGSPKVELCRVQGWDWSDGYIGKVCTSEPTIP